MANKTNTSLVYFTLLVILLAIAVVLFLRSDAFSIETVSIIGTERIDVGEIEQLASGIKGQNLLLFDRDELRQKIKLHPFVKDVDFKRSYPHTLVIDVEERNPIALVVAGNGVVEVDEAGTFLRRFETWPASDLPVISGVVIPDTAGPGQPIDDPLLRKCLMLIQEAPPALLPIIGEIHINAIEQVSLMLTGGVEVRLGDAETWADKLKALVQLLADEGYKQIEHEVRYIDFTAAKPVIGR